MEQKGFAIPEHTQTPNSFFDVTLPQIKSIGELKVLLAIMRQTFGWRKFTDTISLSQLVRITGLSRQGVTNGLQLALEHGYIERTPHGQSFTYGLKLLVKEVDQSTKLTSQETRPEVVKEVDRQLVKQVDTQKKGIKEKKEREIPPPFCGQRFKDALAAFLEHHREIRKPYKPTGLKRLYCDLESWGEEAATEALLTAVRNRWQGVFRPKQFAVLPLLEHPNAYRPGKMIL